MLLIVTNREDLTADFLIARLIELKKPYFRLNSEDLTEAQFSFSIHPHKSSRTISIPAKELQAEDVSCVWYRRKIYARPSPLVQREQRMFVSGEITHLTEGIIADKNILWVNPIESVMLAERKALQLRLASALGFLVPRTIISNVPADIKRFISEVKDVINKPIYHGLYVSKNQRFAIYTNKVTEDRFEDDKQIEICPVFLQEEVRKGFDIRATFIGDDVFAVEIHSPEKLLDWRRPGKSVFYRITNLESQTERLCRDMLKKLNLHFGAFDFVVAESGETYFMEVNPTGEWAWLERELGLPMRDSLISLFGV